MSRQDEQKWQLAGWVSFFACAIVFIVDSIQSGNPIAFTANVLFLIACILFIVPLIYSIRDVSDD